MNIKLRNVSDDGDETLAESKSSVLTINNPNLAYFGFYDYGAGDPSYAGFSNVVIADTTILQNQAAAFRAGGVQVILPVGDLFFRPKSTSPGDQTFVRRNAPPSGPPPEWTAMAPTIAAYRDVIIGFYDLDEPTNKHVTALDLEWAEGLMHEGFPWAKVMVNYGLLPGRVPVTADWVAFDANSVDGTLADWNQVSVKITTLESKLQPGQGLWLGTPTYGTPTHNGDAHDNKLVQRANDYFAVANRRYSRVVGMIGWLWPRVEATGTVFSGLGSKRANGSPKLPKALPRYTKLGKAITRK